MKYLSFEEFVCRLQSSYRFCRMSQSDMSNDDDEVGYSNHPIDMSIDLCIEMFLDLTSPSRLTSRPQLQLERWGHHEATTAHCSLPMLTCSSDEVSPPVRWCCAKLASPHKKKRKRKEGRKKEGDKCLLLQGNDLGSTLTWVLPEIVGGPHPSPRLVNTYKTCWNNASTNMQRCGDDGSSKTFLSLCLGHWGTSQ